MKNQRGQVLLIVILLSTVLLTIGLSVSQITTQETQIAKLEEESKKAFAAAEAGLDAALKTPGGSVVIGERGGGELDLGAGISGQAITDTTPKPTFLTPLLRKDEQYTFYLSTGGPFSGNMTINLNQPTGDPCAASETELAVELTFINSSDYTLARRLIDLCGIIFGGIDERNFAVPFASPGSHLLLLRIIAPESNFPGAKLEIVNSGGNWPLQGKTISSSASTSTGVSKKIQLFQSYPQIPADFFVTSF